MTRLRYVDEFRDGEVARGLAAAIGAEADPGRSYRLMEFCGGHTHAIHRHGIQDLMPANVTFVHGPGCPVCVLPMPRIDGAIELAERHGAIVLTYGDMMRVPAGGRRSLMSAKAAGADIRMVYSTQDALEVARRERGRQVVFFAIGFETTTPPTAVAIRQAAAEGLDNFTVHCNHVLTPAALKQLLEPDDGTPVAVDGFLGPSHVSTVIGSAPYEPFAERYGKPIVITGFEPLDILQATLMALRQLNDGRHEVENQYTRVVTREGNRKARALVAEVFTTRDSFEWRGLGDIPESALRIRSAFAAHDAEARFDLTPSASRDVRGCECPAILRGAKTPTDCRLFGTTCTPETPMGSCMVSSEGACAAYWSYGRFRDAGSARDTRAA